MSKIDFAAILYGFMRIINGEDGMDDETCLFKCSESKGKLLNAGNTKVTYLEIRAL